MALLDFIQSLQCNNVTIYEVWGSVLKELAVLTRLKTGIIDA